MNKFSVKSATSKRSEGLRPICLSLIIMGLFSPAASAVTPEAGTTAIRHQAVADARAGQLNKAIAQLLLAKASHPDDALLTADLIVLLRLAGRNAELVELTQKTTISTIPDYALMDWARALRDQKDFTRAQQVLVDSRHRLGVKAKILYAMVTLEAAQPVAALAALPAETQAGLDAEDLANMAYVYRLAGNPSHALHLSNMALILNPANKSAIREQVFSVSNLGAASLALNNAHQHADMFTQSELNYLRAEQTALNTRNAIQERRRLDDQSLYPLRDQPLTQSLAELDADLISFADDPDLLLRTRHDRVFVLRSLDMMQPAVDEFAALPQPAPSYVRRAAADAYLYLHQPERAAELYQGLIKENPLADVEVYLDLYFAYVESERYEDAGQILSHLDKTTPIWHNDQAQNAAPVENWERVDVDDQLVMDEAYRNHEAIAEQRINALVQQAPSNANLLNTKATIERWRGWPQKSLETTQLAAAYAPQSKDTLINVANNARDLEAFNDWGTGITALKQNFPTDYTVQKSYAEWLDRQRPSISSEYTTGRSRGNANLVAANRDQELLSVLNSPWTASGWRGFIQQHYIWSDYDTGAANYNRLGLGAEWRWARKHAWGVLSNDQLTGENIGIAAGWSQWLNDHWQYEISADSYSLNTPLLAKQAGLSGKSATAKLIWRQNESRDAYMILDALSISDGNDRIDFSTGISQRLWATPHHITTGGIDIFTEHNTQPGGVYFNPANSQSVSLRLEHDWLTWRRYERSFTQYFKLTSGLGQQTGYGSFPVADVFYEHKWTFSRTWELHYGIGWAMQSYDGEREDRTYGLIGFSGVF